jgi:septum formation protein
VVGGETRFGGGETRVSNAGRVRFVLASRSPARLRTLRAAGVDPEVIVSGVDEDELTARARAAGATTGELVRRLAAAKADAVAAELRGTAEDAADDPVLVLGCDSLLDLDGRPLGKPGSRAAAVQRWAAMRGRTGALWTGHHLRDCTSGETVSDAAVTSVAFAEVSDEEIELYCGTGEPAQVAGAFTIDGLGGWFVDSVAGDHHNVVGLSLPLLRRMLNELGYALADIGYPSA